MLTLNLKLNLNQSLKLNETNLYILSQICVNKSYPPLNEVRFADVFFSEETKAYLFFVWGGQGGYDLLMQSFEVINEFMPKL